MTHIDGFNDSEMVAQRHFESQGWSIIVLPKNKRRGYDFGITNGVITQTVEVKQSRNEVVLGPQLIRIKNGGLLAIVDMKTGKVEEYTKDDIINEREVTYPQTRRFIIQLKKRNI